MQKFFKQLLPIAWLMMAAVAAWVLVERLQGIALDDITRQLREVPLSTLLAALACSAGVYVSVGAYEGLAVRLATGRKMFLHAFRTAVTANPLGRAIGLAIVSGGALRYRFYAPEGLTMRQVGAVIVLGAMPYAFGVGWLIDLSLLFHAREASTALRLPVTVILVLGVLGLLKDVGWLAFVATRAPATAAPTADTHEHPHRDAQGSSWRRALAAKLQHVPLPTLRQALLQIAFGLAQISMMTAILYLFMPPELGMSWPAFVAIYCIAFLAGQLSNVPAGLGVLEAALLLMLPQVPPAKLLGAVLAYRAVYELVPLGVALLLLLAYEATNKAGVLRRKFSR